MSAYMSHSVSVWSFLVSEIRFDVFLHAMRILLLHEASRAATVYTGVTPIIQPARVFQDVHWNCTKYIAVSKKEVKTQGRFCGADKQGLGVHGCVGTEAPSVGVRFGALRLILTGEGTAVCYNTRLAF